MDVGPPSQPAQMTDLAGPAPTQHAQRRWGIRARLIALVVGVAAVALVVVDIALPLALRSVLVANQDATLNRALANVPDSFPFTKLQELSSPGSEVGFSLIVTDGVVLVEPPESNRGARPDVTSMQVPGPAVSVGDTANPSATYRAVSRQMRLLDGRDVQLVAWLSMDNVSNAVGRVVVIELLITAGLLVLLGTTASLVIRRELRPLESMARAADDIAVGNLGLRVQEGAPGTEIGRLGAAFNGMLDGISGLLDERARSEDRLRQFVADASHELRTPVAAVRGYTDLYRAGALGDDAAVDRAMERMGFEAQRMGALVEDLLTLIQADTEASAAPERVDLRDLLAGVVDDAAVIDPTRQWRLMGTDAPVVVLGDRMRLHQLFANLLSNVRTHTPAGTTATVSVLPGAQGTAVSVSDNGPGVSDQDLGRLFDRFYRVDPSRSRNQGGTGLGLSIVAAITRAHGGRILATHTPGGGLTVTVVLPRPVGTAAVPERANANGTPAAARAAH